MPLITELMLRKAARNFLLPRLESPIDVLVDELVIPDGRARVDLALVNGHVEAFELKSDFDSLRRLPSQAERYEPYFDRITLVTTRRFSERAVSLLPTWWGIVVAECKRDKICLRWNRRALLNPSMRFEKQCQFLWKEDLLRLSRNHAVNIKGRHAMGKEELTQVVMAAGVSRSLKSEMRTLLKSRIHSLTKLR